jgi:putative DNA primase/helicase
VGKKIKVFNRTDLGNAEHFAALYKDKIRFDYLRGKWFIWNDVRWREDDDGEMYRLAKRAIRERRLTAELLDDDLKEKEIKHTLACESRNRITAMLDLAKGEKRLADNGRNWDVDPWLLGTESGVVDLRSGELLPPDPHRRVTMTTGYAFDPDATCPTWDKIVPSYWDDPEIVRYFTKALGYSLTGTTHEQCLFTLYGLGENGKSTLVTTVKRVVGDYGYVMPFSTIEAQARASVSNDVAALVGKRYVMSSETQEDIRLNEGRIKSLTGDTEMTARFLYRENFSFRPVAKFWLAFNHKPRVFDDSHGFWRRIRMVHMDKTFSDSDKISDLEGKLLEEKAGILNWLIRACLLWRREGLFTPKVLQDATDLYREESDPLAEFLDECTTAGADLATPKGEGYRAYKIWARENGRVAIGPHKFGQRLETRGITDDRIGAERTRVWRGFELNSGVPTEL